MDSLNWSCLMMLEKKYLLENEIFKPVPKYEGFISASNKGRIYSHERSIKKFCGLSKTNVIQKYKGRLLTQHSTKGYLRVRFGINGEKCTELVSRLVLMAFDREPSNNEFACHNDSNPLNNSVENLRWDFQKGNMIDRDVRGLYKHSEHHHAAKVPVELVDALQRKQITAKDAAHKYGFVYSNLWCIANGKTWKKRFAQNLHF